jgi:hypothetical protein
MNPVAVITFGESPITIAALFVSDAVTVTERRTGLDGRFCGVFDTAMVP